MSFNPFAKDKTPSVSMFARDRAPAPKLAADEDLMSDLGSRYDASSAFEPEISALRSVFGPFIADTLSSAETVEFHPDLVSHEVRCRKACSSTSTPCGDLWTIALELDETCKSPATLCAAQWTWAAHVVIAHSSGALAPDAETLGLERRLLGMAHGILLSTLPGFAGSQILIAQLIAGFGADKRDIPQRSDVQRDERSLREAVVSHFRFLYPEPSPEVVNLGVAEAVACAPCFFPLLLFFGFVASAVSVRGR